MIAMLRAAGANLDVDACLSWIPAARVEACWRVGDVRKGKPAQTSGFNMLLSDSEDVPTAIAGAHTLLASLMPHVRRLVETGVGVAVDLGVEVYAVAPTSVTLPPAFLAQLAQAGVDLVISAYPCSGED